MTDLTTRRKEYEDWLAANIRPLAPGSGPGPNPPAASPADTSGLSVREAATSSVSRTDDLPASGILVVGEEGSLHPAGRLAYGGAEVDRRGSESGTSKD